MMPFTHNNQEQGLFEEGLYTLCIGLLKGVNVGHVLTEREG